MKTKKKTPRKRTGPLAEKPILVGFTAKEAQLLARAAAITGVKRTTFIHNVALVLAGDVMQAKANLKESI